MLLYKISKKKNTVTLSNQKHTFTYNTVYYIILFVVPFKYQVSFKPHVDILLNGDKMLKKTFSAMYPHANLNKKKNISANLNFGNIKSIIQWTRSIKHITAT